MLAVPLSRQHPREPRYGRLILAILGFFVYYNLQVLGRGQLQRGHWHHPSALWLIDGIVFVWGAWLFRNQYVERRLRKRAR